MKRRNLKTTVMSLSLVFVWVGSALADTTMLFQSFDEEADSPREVEGFYPAWEFIPANADDQADVRVVDGVLRLQGNQHEPTRLALTDSPQGAFYFSADVGTDPGYYCVNVGIEIGQNEIVFHPGYPGTALRVEGAGGFGNQNLGFTLVEAALHHFTLAHDGEGLFEITLTDAYDAANTTTMQFRNEGSIGGRISLTRAGCVGAVSEGLFDNIEITIPGDINVAIDVKPGSYPNSINLGSHGLIPVAILSSNEFDATAVEAETVQLSGAGVDVHGKSDKYMAHEEDVNGDGLVDLVVQVATENLNPNSFQDGYAVLTGSTYDGQTFEGVDEITIVPPEK